MGSRRFDERTRRLEPQGTKEGRPLMIRLLTTLVVGLILLLGAGATVSAAPGGNSATSELCDNDRWQVLQTTDGDSLKNERQCVRYGAQGGSPEVAPHGSLTLVHLDTCRYTLNATGFIPNTEYRFERSFGGVPPISNMVTTDGSGSFGPSTFDLVN